MRTHPHAEATYRVIPTSEGAFAVEVTIPDTHPAIISSFASAQAAEAWIASNQQRVTAEGVAGRWFQKSKGNFRR
jgi:heme-degrading monooxygenase HmoA